MNPLEAALDYAARGWPVFPVYEPDGLGWCACGNPECKSPAKHPRNRDGFKGATTDRALIERWWHKHPKASIGIATGAGSGLWVLDVDPKDGGNEQLAHWEKAYGPLPVTMLAETGSGGRHIFFQHLDGLRISSGKNGGPLGKGLDTRADGGYVVASPSLHLSGGQYRWINGPGTPLAPIPGWVLDLENQRLQRKKLEMSKRVEAVKNAGPRHADFKEAARAYNAANAQEYPKNPGPCPICPGLSGFKAHGRVPGRWACFNSKHTFGGTKRDGHWMGDQLDIDAAKAGRTRKEHLEVSGYWGAGVRAEQFYARRAANGPAQPQTTQPQANDDPPDNVVDIATGVSSSNSPTRLAALSKSFASLCDILEQRDLVKPLLHDAEIEFCEMGAKVTIDRRPVEDHDILKLRRNIELTHCDRQGFGLTFSDLDIFKALDLVARSKPYHPVREYLGALRWDGTSRVEHIAEDFFGCEGTPIERAMLKRWMISAVARAMRPGCKVDTSLILCGPQGYRKSSFFKALAAPEWFSDSQMDLSNKDSYLQIRDVWVYEWSELNALNSARDVETVKAFLSSSEDLFRVPYGRGIVRVPRSCVIVGTTNRAEFLTDPTGYRRFWPITVRTEIDIDAVTAGRDQLWAEAVALFEAGEQWFLTDEEAALLAPVHDRHRQIDPWEPLVERWICGPEAALEPVTTARVLEKGIAKPAGQWSRADEMRVAKILKDLGYELRQRRERGARLREWFREEASQPAPTCSEKVGTENQ